MLQFLFQMLFLEAPKMFCESAVSIPINLNLQKEAYLHVKFEQKWLKFAKCDLFEF